MDLISKLSQLDRRWIFILVAIFVIVPQIIPVALPIEPVPPVISIFDYIENLPEGSRVMFAFDYSPASEAELYPMSIALMRHCFERKLRVLTCTLNVTGKGVISRAFSEMEEEYDITHGIDYVDFGFQVGGFLVIIQAGKDFIQALPVARAQRTQDMEITKGIEKIGQIDYVIDIASGSTVDWWVAYGKEAYGFELGAGCTAVMATQFYPYLDTGQLNGLIGGLKGVAEYEILLNDRYGDKEKTFLGLGTSGMSSQSAVHMLIVFLVLANNIIYFATRKKS